MSFYSKRNDVFDVFERMMSSLIISKPADPLKVKLYNLKIKYMSHIIYRSSELTIVKYHENV